ncbi:ParB/RepB/Spo0J family partition protein [Helicobacter sp. MIT 99-5507]|uniref:ParB/RepB/Spo0J family partition protein n=1 Tax=Helicobacter sp. MIT 99-5507 TaxID=152489 RepID=UPI000E1E49EF|nr:ParB/RepB/Spo0J family partition protein [Helicobacter sp. MIT 99-5507]RDU58394.1 chromosome partitioning protein ParB [Helicobacter sp. MIT 99-5507]
MVKKKALGRGLSAVLGEVEQAYDNNLNDNSDLVVELDIDLIKPNPLQPRKKFNESTLLELSNSIKEHGILQPILVYEDNNEYFLIAGERRLRASKLAKLNTMKAIVVDIKLEKLRELALIENIQREDLNPIDLAISYDALIKDYNITQDELAQRLQKSRTQITNTLSLLRLPKEVQKLLIDGKISQGHAKVLVNLNGDDFNLAINSIVGQKLSVRETENLVKNIKRKKTNKENINFTNELNKIASFFQNNQLDVKISNNAITIKFTNKEKVDRLLQILSNFKDL